MEGFPVKHRIRQQATKYHYILTIQQTRGGRTEQYTSTGTIMPKPGATRQEVFNYVRQLAEEQENMPDAVTLFFALEPDVLS
jgi:hypothetical protein